MQWIWIVNGHIQYLHYLWQRLQFWYYFASSALPLTLLWVAIDTHAHTHTHSVNLTRQEGNSVIRLSRSLDMNLKTVGSVQSNQVIKLIIWEELYSKTYYLWGVKWLSGPQRPDGLVWLDRRGKREEEARKYEGGGEETRGGSEQMEDGGKTRRLEERERTEMKWGETKLEEEGGRRGWFIGVGSHFHCLFATPVKPIFCSGLGNILYFIKRHNAAFCLCWGSSHSLWFG